jgi:hypothetical protein
VYDVFSVGNFFNRTDSDSRYYKHSLGEELILDSDGDTSIQASSDDIMVFDTGGSERARLDGSGNLFVSATATSGFQSSSSESGSIIYGAGGIASNSASNDVPAVFNRLGNDGSIIQLKKDGSTVGNVGSVASGANVFISANSGVGLGIGDDNLYPVNASGASTDNSLDLGDAAARFNDLYLGGGLYVGGTGSANHLDDYEEGTWTPGVIGSGTAGSFSGGSVSGNYTRIGNSVAVWFGVTGTQSGASGSLTITGLPFTSKSGVEAIGQLMWSSLNVTDGRINFVFYIGGDSTSMVIFESIDDAAWGTLSVSNEEFALRGQLNYLV